MNKHTFNKEYLLNLGIPLEDVPKIDETLFEVTVDKDTAEYNAFFDKYKSNFITSISKVPRSLPKVSQVRTAIEAIFTAGQVTEEIRIERERTCLMCEYVKKDPNPYCSLCGCCIVDSNRILNLTRYNEKLPKWGCKHPGRSHGKGWSQ